MNPPGLSMVYTNCHQAMRELKREVKLFGDEVEATSVNSTQILVICKELIGVTFQVLNWTDRVEALDANGYDIEFALKDFEDRINPNRVNPGSAVECDTSGCLKPYLSPKSGRLSYTYSERMNPQLELVIETLMKNPQSRQAFLSVWDRNADGRFLERRRVPCSIGYHFLLREEELHMMYIMRSLDVEKCLGYDLYTSSKLLEYVADRLQVERGFLQFFVGSAHLFEEVAN
jgi:thymidylate synthase